MLAVVLAFLGAEALEIVSELPEISDAEEDEQEVAAVSDLDTEPDTDEQVEQEESEDQADQEDEAAVEPDPSEFKQRLVAVMPNLKKAIAAESPLTADLKKYAEAAQKLAKANQFDKGIAVLD